MLWRVLQRPWTLPLALLAVDLAVAALFWRPVNADLRDFLIPWYRFIIGHGRFDAFGQAFSNYAPAYLYLLSLASLADRLAEPAWIIRVLSTVASLGAALLAARVARAAGHSAQASAALGVSFFLLPEVLVNGPLWGQCDILYSAFLVAFVALAARGRSLAALAMLGVAFSFKLQTVFIGPFVLYLLWTGVLRWRHLAVVPLVYLVSVTPAALAGRDWSELLTLYFNQFGYYRQLSMNAPNLYWLIDRYLPGHYEMGVRIGLVVATAVGLALTAAFVRRGPTRALDELLLMATVSLAAMPFALPKMHERYFFAAGVMAFMLAVVRPAAWPVVMLLQAASLAAYSRFLLEASNAWVALGVVLMTGAMAWLAVLFAAGRRSGPAAANGPLAAQAH